MRWIRICSQWRGGRGVFKGVTPPYLQDLFSLLEMIHSIKGKSQRFQLTRGFRIYTTLASHCWVDYTSCSNNSGLLREPLDEHKSQVNDSPLQEYQFRRFDK
jgi:hypothetical protein